MAQPSAKRRRILLLLVLGVGLGVRTAHWLWVRQEPFVAFPIMDSLAYLEWAREIADGAWLGEGSSFLSPLYPYLVALLLLLCGGSLDAVYLFQIAVAVVGLWALYRAGEALEGPDLGFAAAGLAALCGPLVFHDVLLLKESLAASLTAILLWILTRRGLADRWRPWLAAGAVWGLVSLLRENAVLLLPFLGLLAWIRRRSWRGLGKALGGLVLGYLLVSSPFMLRSLALTGSPLPTHNAGFNFYIGNNPEATGTYRSIVAGKTMPEAESREPIRLASRLTGRRLTPQEASRFWLGRSLRWMVEEPGDFARLQLEKLGLFWRFYEWPDAVDYYWIKGRSPPLRGAFVELGALAVLAASALWLVRGRLRLWAPVLLLVVGWTLATIAFFVFSRFRVPMLPALCLLAGAPLVSWYRALSAGRTTVSILGALGIAGALLFPHLLGFEPDRRLVAYNLGGIYSALDQTGRARQQYLTALEEAPEDPLPLQRLGDLALRRGDLERASAWYRRATEVAPASDDAWSLYGRSLVLRGELDDARKPLNRALELNQSNAVALHGLGMLALAQGDLRRARALRDRIREVAPEHPLAGRLDTRIESRRRSDDGAPPDPRW